MEIQCISFTQTGWKLGKKLQKSHPELKIRCVTKCRQYYETEDYVAETLQQWVGYHIKEKQPLIFIGACGIAVRAIAPFVRDKLSDPPVLVVDEQGNYVIPILSGHVGGANALARTIAQTLSAIPVITTATDLQEKFAVDLFAKKNHLKIMNKEGIARVSAKILAGEPIVLYMEPGHWNEEEKLPEGLQVITNSPTSFVDVAITTKDFKDQAALWLCPTNLVLGMGCRKDKEPEDIAHLIEDTLKDQGFLEMQVEALVSIDLKKDEKGFLFWSKSKDIPFRTYSSEMLSTVQGVFSTSNFVKEHVGVDNVCERAALCGCKGKGKLIYPKHAVNGMTIAIAESEWRVTFDETN